MENKHKKEINEREKKNLLYLQTQIKSFIDFRDILLAFSDGANAGLFMPRLDCFVFDGCGGENIKIEIDEYLSAEEAHLFRSELGMWIKDYIEERRIASFERETEELICKISERWN